jgi:hypothetical protein
VAEPAEKGTCEETPSRSARSLSPGCERPSGGPRRACCGRIAVVRASAELTPAFRGNPSVSVVNGPNARNREQRPGAHSDDAHRTAAHRVACLASRLPSGADPIGARAPVVSDVILRQRSGSAGRTAAAAGRAPRGVGRRPGRAEDGRERGRDQRMSTDVTRCTRDRLAARRRCELKRLAAEIRREHEAAEDSWRDALAHAVRAGERLIQAKRLVKHGEWLPYLAAAGVPQTTASAYVRVAANQQHVAGLPTLRAALAELAVPRDRPVPAAVPPPRGPLLGPARRPALALRAQPERVARRRAPLPDDGARGHLRA